MQNVSLLFFVQQIKKKCTAAEDCDECMFYLNGICSLNNRPDKWPDVEELEKGAKE